MAQVQSSGLLGLPWELRRAIIHKVLHSQHSRAELPSFNQELVESRVRICNCFDAKFPKLTNFYVPKLKFSYLPYHGLRCTNRQLREETDRAIKEELKPGSNGIPFVLDVMIVKDIGVFPTWMSFPYQPKHLEKLTINLRIIRPETSTLVPDEWVEMARHKDDGRYSPVQWNLLMAISMYAFGVFSVKQDPTLPHVQSNRQLAITEDAAPAYLSETTDNKIEDTELTGRPKAEEASLSAQTNLKNHQSQTFDAYRLPSASWVTDELLLKFEEFEYDTNNEIIPPPSGFKGITYYLSIPHGVVEASEDGQFYKPGYVQFGRDVFSEYEVGYGELGDLEQIGIMASKGMFASDSLVDVMIDILRNCADEEYSDSIEAPYLAVLAHSAGIIRHTAPGESRIYELYRIREWWTVGDAGWEFDVRDGELYCSDEVIERHLARELARDPPDKGQLLRWQTVKVRKAHGWIQESEELE